MNEKQAQALFNAQYLGQVVESNIATPNLATRLISIFHSVNYGGWFLLLRSIDQLTDEEIKTIADLNGWSRPEISKERYEERLIQYRIDLPCICKPGYFHRHMKFVYDYLTRIGILIPFTYINEEGIVITLQPAEIIDRGWARIKEISSVEV